MTQPQFEEERDDAIVGRAFVWSALVIVVIAGVGGAVYWRMSIKPPQVVQSTNLIKPEVRERPKVEISNMPFTD